MPVKVPLLHVRCRACHTSSLDRFLRRPFELLFFELSCAGR